MVTIIFGTVNLQNINWPQRSCDSTPLDNFLWNYVKSQVYRNDTKSIPELNNGIVHVITEIESQLYQNVIENFNIREDVCRPAREGRLFDIIYRT